jgi:hypothetical protein
MESGRRISTPPSPQSFPAVKHLVWAFVAGTVLVVSGLRDDSPPQPPAARTVTAPAPPGTSAWPARPAVRLPASAPLDVRAPAYLAPDRPALEPPSSVHSAAAPPALLPRPYVRPASPRPMPPSPAPTYPAAAPAPPVPSRSAAVSRPAVQPLPPSAPLRLRIPGITVNAPLMKLGLDKAGSLEPPPDNNPALAGWYAGGTVPGTAGTAITAGHVDTRLGPGVFHKLGSLRAGATIEIDRADLRTAVFTVYAVEAYSKKNFPDQKVYGPSGRPELRVITCGGDYRKKSGYQDNVVVFAALTASR